MKNLIYKDLLISRNEMDMLLAEYSSFIKTNTGIVPQFTIIDYDFSDYPTVLDTDGDDVMRPNFLQSIADTTKKKYGGYGMDNIVTFIHNKNWKSGKTATRKGIWGTNYSYKYGSFHIQYCRWDSKNIANSFGTLNHEQDHTYDALIKVEIGIDVNPILGVTAYDRDTTHGGKPPHKYIRHKENADKLKTLAPYLKRAYEKRREREKAELEGLRNTAISLIEKMLYILRSKLNSKNGVKI
jgi:hypothetical protein